MAYAAVKTKKEFGSSTAGTGSNTNEYTHDLDFIHNDDIEVWVTQNATTAFGVKGVPVLQIKGATVNTDIGTSHPQTSNTGTRKPEVASTIHGYGYTISTDGTKVTIGNATYKPATADIVTIQRYTRDQDANYENFVSGSTLSHTQLNNAFKQVRYQAQEARNGIMGGVAGVAAGDSVDAAGMIGTVPAAQIETTALDAGTTSAKGVLQVGTNLSVSAGTVSVPDATDSVKGVVKVGTNLSVSSGTVSVVDAATDAKGVVKIGSNLSVSSGTVSVADGTDSVKGVLKIADNLTTNDGSVALSAKQGKELEDGKLDLAGGTMTGAIAMGTKKITGLGDPTSDQDAATKKHISDNYYSKTDADAKYYTKTGSPDQVIKSGEVASSWPTDGTKDDFVVTPGAVDLRVTELVEEVGGFIPIDTELLFPNDNPDINDNAGTLVSIKSLSTNYTSNGSGEVTISNGNIANSKSVKITGLANSTTYASGNGMIVETQAFTASSDPFVYKFHRLTPKASEVSIVADSTYKGKIEIVAASDYKADVEAVADSTYKAKVTAVADDSTDIGAVAAKITDVETVADNITDVSNFADLYQIATSAPTARADSSSLVLGDLWFDSDDKVMMVRDGSAGDGYSAVSPSQAVLDDIAIVSGDLTRQEDLGSIVDQLASPTTTSDLETCADNIDAINAFANTYFIASSAPSGSNVGAGDLWYDSANNVLKYNTGSAWTVTAGAGLSALADDNAPELSGNLDCNSKNLTEVGTINAAELTGTNLTIDFGTL